MATFNFKSAKPFEEVDKLALNLQPTEDLMPLRLRWGLRVAKRIVDVLFALLFFVCFGWLYLIVALGVLLTSGHPILYSQPRFGRNGKEFRFYKFRSMVPDAKAVLEDYLKKNPDAEQQWKAYQKLENDPRVTKFGALIRRTSIDELPQFWNVLIGDMSIVGPRPCMLQQKELYGTHWEQYCAVRPGITGLWQVSGRNQLSFEARVQLDAEYVKSLSVSGDIRIFVKTIFVVLTGQGSH